MQTSRSRIWLLWRHWRNVGWLYIELLATSLLTALHIFSRLSDMHFHRNLIFFSVRFRIILITYSLDSCICLGEHVSSSSPLVFTVSMVTWRSCRPAVPERQRVPNTSAVGRGQLQLICIKATSQNQPFWRQGWNRGVWGMDKMHDLFGILSKILHRYVLHRYGPTIYFSNIA